MQMKWFMKHEEHAPVLGDGAGEQYGTFEE